MLIVIAVFIASIKKKVLKLYEVINKKKKQIISL